jgi:hypothetical protein
VHFGTECRIAVGLQVQALVPGQLRCTNLGEDPVTLEPAPSWFEDDDPEPSLVRQLTYSLGG